MADLDEDRVPSELRPLLPIARRWGISDDVYRVDDVDRATDEEIASLLKTADDAPELLWTWLVGHESHREPPTNEYVALTCLTLTFDQVLALSRPPP